MMGERTVMQEELFYSFRIEDHVPQDHLLRSVDRFVDLTGIREHLKPFYSSTGRPSVDPELMIRMLLIGYCMGIRCATDQPYRGHRRLEHDDPALFDRPDGAKRPEG